MAENAGASTVALHWRGHVLILLLPPKTRDSEQVAWQMLREN